MPLPAARKPGLSVFFPAYNDSGTIASLVITALQAARRLTPDFEVIIVNDGSADSTAAIADELARTYPEVRVVHHQWNRGYGGALRSGFAAATRELIFYTDGDAQYDPAEMTLLWEAFDDRVDLVNGYKISRSDPLHRIVIGRIYHHTVKLLFGLKVRDVDCDFRLLRRSIFDRGVAREEQRRDLPRDDEEDPGCRVQDRRSAGAPLSPRLRPVAVLQLPPAVPDGDRRREAVVRAGDTPCASPLAFARSRRRPRGGMSQFAKAARIAADLGRPAAARPRGSRVTDLQDTYRGYLPRPPRHDYGRPRVHRQQPGAAAGRSRRRGAHRRCAAAGLRRQSLQHRRDRRARAREHRRRAHAEHDGCARDGAGGHLQPRRAGQPHRQHAGSVHGPRDQLPRAAVDPGGLPHALPGSPRRLCRHAPGLRPPGLSAGGRTAPGASGRHQRRQQGGRRVLPSPLQQRLRPAGVLAAVDQRLRPASAHPAQPPGLHRLVHPAGDRRQGNPDLRRRIADARFRLRRRRRGRVPARGRVGHVRRRRLQRRRRRADHPPRPRRAARRGGGRRARALRRLAAGEETDRHRQLLFRLDEVPERRRVEACRWTCAKGSGGRWRSTARTCRTTSRRGRDPVPAAHTWGRCGGRAGRHRSGHRARLVRPRARARGVRARVRRRVRGGRRRRRRDRHRRAGDRAARARASGRATRSSRRRCPPPTRRWRS